MFLFETFLFQIFEQLFSFGNNETGQLGRDSTEILDEQTVRRWLKPSLIETLKNRKVDAVWPSAHGFFVRLETDKQEILASGLNSYGQLGERFRQKLETPIEIEIFDKIESIRSISAGIHHTLILDERGRVFGLGRSDDGRLGSIQADSNELRQIEGLSKIVEISAGSSVSFAIDSDGNVFSFGMGLTLQTGHGYDDVFYPTAVHGKQLVDRFVEQISVGAQHTLFLVREKFEQ